jgi:hypothetical protein
VGSCGFWTQADYRHERSAKLHYRKREDHLDREVLSVNAHVTPQPFLPVSGNARDRGAHPRSRWRRAVTSTGPASSKDQMASDF